MTMDDEHRFSERITKEAATVSMADFDLDAYRPYLDGINLGEAQEAELLRTLWDIMRCFVELDVPAESWGQIVASLSEGVEDDSAPVE